jgi:hypothetical protein
MPLSMIPQIEEVYRWQLYVPPASPTMTAQLPEELKPGVDDVYYEAHGLQPDQWDYLGFAGVVGAGNIVEEPYTVDRPEFKIQPLTAKTMIYASTLPEGPGRTAIETIAGGISSVESFWAPVPNAYSLMGGDIAGYSERVMHDQAGGIGTDPVVYTARMPTYESPTRFFFGAHPGFAVGAIAGEVAQFAIPYEKIMGATRGSKLGFTGSYAARYGLDADDVLDVMRLGQLSEGESIRHQGLTPYNLRAIYQTGDLDDPIKGMRLAFTDYEMPKPPEIKTPKGFQGGGALKRWPSGGLTPEQVIKAEFPDIKPAMRDLDTGHIFRSDFSNSEFNAKLRTTFNITPSIRFGIPAFHGFGLGAESLTKLTGGTGFSTLAGMGTDAMSGLGLEELFGQRTVSDAAQRGGQLTRQISKQVQRQFAGFKIPEYDFPAPRFQQPPPPDYSRRKRASFDFDLGEGNPLKNMAKYKLHTKERSNPLSGLFTGRIRKMIEAFEK